MAADALSRYPVGHDAIGGEENVLSVIEGREDVCEFGKELEWGETPQVLGIILKDPSVRLCEWRKRRVGGWITGKMMG